MKVPILLPNIFDYPFTYESEKKVEVGQYVLVPFGKSNAIGVVWDQFQKSNKVLINKPQGGFYLMPEFLNKKFNSSVEMCDDILNKTGVALLPGSDFGFDQNRMLARLSFTDFDGKKFMEEIEDNTKIDDTLINELAPKMVEGVDKLKKWSESI